MADVSQHWSELLHDGFAVAAKRLDLAADRVVLTEVTAEVATGVAVEEAMEDVAELIAEWTTTSHFFFRSQGNYFPHFFFCNIQKVS